MSEKGESMGNVARMVRTKRQVVIDPDMCVWGECQDEKVDDYLCSEHRTEFDGLVEVKDRIGIRQFMKRGFLSPTTYPDLLEK